MLTGNEEVDKLRSLNLGTATDILENKSGSPLEKLLKDQIQGIIDELIKSIAKYDISASGSLQQSIKPTNPVLDSNGISVGISVGEKNYYWKFINKGVNGTEVNHGAPNWGYQGQSTDYKQNVLDWIRNRGITVNGSETYDQLAFKIMRSIKLKGKAPRPFFDDVVKDPKLIELLKKPIEKLLGRAIEVKIAEPWQ